MSALQIAATGAVSASGQGMGDFLAALAANRFPRDHGHANPDWAARRYAVSLVTGVTDKANRAFPDRDLRRLDRVSTLALLAADDALARAGLNPPLGPETGLILATTHGALGFSTEFHQKVLASGAGGLSALLFSSSLLSSAAGALALELGVCGPVHTLAVGATAAPDVLELATMMLASGTLSRVIAVGAEMFHPVCFDGYDALFRLHARCGRPPEPVRTFCFAEGAAALVLEPAPGPAAVPTVRGIAGTEAPCSWQTPLRPRLEACWERVKLTPNAADLYFPGRNHTFLDRLEAEAVQRPSTGRTIALKSLLGEGFAFTSVLQVAVAAELLEVGGTALTHALHFDGALGAVALERKVP